MSLQLGDIAPDFTAQSTEGPIQFHRWGLTITYPQTAGRNFDEILRVIDSLQLTDRHSVSTPVNWRTGDDVIIVPSVSDAEAQKRFPAGWRSLKPYLRLTPDPRGLSEEPDRNG